MDSGTDISNHNSEAEIIQEPADRIKEDDIAGGESPNFSWVELCSVKMEKEDEPEGDDDIGNEDDGSFMNYDTPSFGLSNGFKQECPDSDVVDIKDFNNDEISRDAQLSDGPDYVHSITFPEVVTSFGDHVFPCSYCGITCSSLFYLEKHSRNCRKKHGIVEIHDSAKHVCNICNRAFKQIGHLQRHKRTHTGEKPYECQMCNMKFSQSTNYKRHLQTHSQQKPYGCSECDKRFYKLDNLKSHMRVHSDEKDDRPYECVICHAKFTWTGNLRNHMRTHTGERPYDCTVCDAKFSQSGHLKKHMLLHKGEKPYKCDHCNAEFCQSVNLENHLRKHTGERPFGCTVCELRFRQSSHLKRHMLIHSGEKPYCCDICGLKFIQSIHLKKHMIKHAKQNEIPCGVINTEGFETHENNIAYDSICNGDTNGS